VMLEHSTTGDGLLTGLHLLARVAATGQSLSELAGVMRRLPQVLVNVKGVNRTGMGDSAELAEAVAAAEAELGTSGRVLLRPSGTEPVVRVMVEAASADQAQSVADRLVDAVREYLPLPG
jgi:phosphoglucosamine mutase